MADLGSLWPRHEWWATILRQRAADDLNLRDAIEALVEWYRQPDDVLCDWCPLLDGVYEEGFDDEGPLATHRRGYVTIKPQEVYL